MDYREPVGVEGVPMMHQEFVHVVTVTHNSASTLRQFFAALVLSKDHIAGVTIVDSASVDATKEIVRAQIAKSELSIELIENANDGFAGGYARARDSKYERGLPVLALNPDVAIAPGVIAAMLDVINNSTSAGIVTAPLVDLAGAEDTASRRRLPKLGGSILYSIMGSRTPAALRYNSLLGGGQSEEVTVHGVRVSPLEATTGAMMLISPRFRTIEEGLFDTDYWMYGEDLQLCLDARAAGWLVLMAEVGPSIHVKAVSSGRPRSQRSNRAFHSAMVIYARKNLVRSPAALLLLRVGIGAHFLLSEVRAVPSRLRQARHR